jgi:hypothetical protein
MPRYFFNVRDDRWIADGTGVELASDDVARREAQHMAQYFPKYGGGQSTAAVVVTDQKGAVVWEIAVWRP